MASLRRLRSVYYARIIYTDDTGKRKEKKFNLHTKQRAKAERLLPNIEKREKLFKAGIISLDQVASDEVPKNQPLVDEFVEAKKLEKNVTDKTISLYNLALDTLLNIFKEKNILRLNKSDYPIFISKMREKYPNVNTLNIRLRTCRTFFNWLTDHGKIEKPPFKIKPLPVPKKKPRYFTDQEINSILDHLKETKQDEVYARVYVHWMTGLRLGEFNNSYLENGFIRTYDPCKHGFERSIPVNDQTGFYYTWFKDNSKYTDETISKKFLKVIRKLGLYETRSGDTRHFHNLRDTFAIKTYYQTRDIFKVSKLLGHGSVTTTEIYANFNIDLLDKDFGNIDKEDNQAVVNKPNISKLQKFYVEKYGVNYVN